VLTLIGWASSPERKHTPELQSAGRDNVDVDHRFRGLSVIPPSFVRYKHPEGKLLYVLIESNVDLGPGPIWEIEPNIVPDTQGADFLEALCNHDGWSKEFPGVIIFSSRDELDGARSALEGRGWVFKGEKSPWPMVFLLAGSHPEKGHRIKVGYVEKAEDK